MGSLIFTFTEIDRSELKVWHKLTNFFVSYKDA